MSSQDPYNLDRFIEAQDPVYSGVCAELRQGRKTSHWMWFVFPQIQGLGSSPMARKFAISSLEEARAYLQHPVLGPRLEECTRLVCKISEKSIDDIFNYPDDMKFHSSMTLFALAAPDRRVFEEALERHFEGERDAQTLQSVRG